MNEKRVVATNRTAVHMGVGFIGILLILVLQQCSPCVALLPSATVLQSEHRTFRGKYCTSKSSATNTLVTNLQTRFSISLHKNTPTMRRYMIDPIDSIVPGDANRNSSSDSADDNIDTASTDSFAFNSSSVSEASTNIQGINFLSSAGVFNSSETISSVNSKNRLSKEKIEDIKKEAQQLISMARSEIKSKVKYAKTLKEIPDERDRFVGDIWHVLKTIFNSTMRNIQQGEAGKRGEWFFILQLLLAQFILFGVPLFLVKLIQFSGWVYFFSGVVFIGNSLWELRENLSPFPAPAEENRLVSSGVYSYVRHPMYGGLLMMCVGVAVTTYDFDRIFLSIALGFLLNFKADFEEKLLKKTHQEQYEEFSRGKKKLIPFLL